MGRGGTPCRDDVSVDGPGRRNPVTPPPYGSGMSASSIQLIGGESPWEIVRAYPYIEVEPMTGRVYQIRCQTPDDSGWPFVRALECLTAEEQRRYTDDIAAGREPAGTEEMCAARALLRLVSMVNSETGAEPPAWKTFRALVHARSRHPSARAERLRGGHTRRLG